jgi:site-specific recombinase XerC
MNATVHALRPGPELPNGIGQFPAVCGICGVPHPTVDCAVLGRHVEWLRLRGLAATTIYDRKRVMVRLGAALPVPVLDATAGDLAAWRAALNVSARSVQTYVMHAGQFYDWAAAEGLIKANPAAGLPVPQAPRYLPRPVAEEDLMRALAMASPRVRPYLVLAGWAGMRCCEISGLTVDCILFAAQPPAILIRAAATKGGHERIIPMSPFVVSELRAAGLPARGLAFPRQDGKPGPMKPWVVSRLGCEALHNAGVPDTFHSLRHRFATQAWRASHDLLAVQSLMGHANPNQTAVYALYDRPGATQAVCALPVPGSRE